MTAPDRAHPTDVDARAAAEAVAAFRADIDRLLAEIGRAIVGQAEVVNEIAAALLAGGHVLLEGVPGLGKTLLVRTLAEALDLTFSRIQFTPDLMPADIIGTNVIVEDGPAGERRSASSSSRGRSSRNIVLADEINRATPKTQSALLEAMQEQSVTVAASRPTSSPPPFFVLATQNPIEMEGTYPLPEAQLDRFLFKLRVRIARTRRRCTGSSSARRARTTAAVRAGARARAPARDAGAGAAGAGRAPGAGLRRARCVEATHPARPTVAPR